MTFGPLMKLHPKQLNNLSPFNVAHTIWKQPKGENLDFNLL